MRTIEDGGSAFPREDYQTDSQRGQPGMSLRDYFAAAALMGVYASGNHRDVASAIQDEQQRMEMSLTPTQVGHFAEARIAGMVYAVADAMIKARDTK